MDQAYEEIVKTAGPSADKVTEPPHLKRGKRRDITTKFKPTVPSKLSPLLDEPSKSIILGRSDGVHQMYGLGGLMDVGAMCEKQLEGDDLTGYRVLLDMVYPHVVFICGKRGSGKSYTLGIIAEELARNKLGVGTVIIDPIGIFWSLKHENKSAEEVSVLKKWNMEPEAMENVKVYVPVNYYNEMRDRADEKFSVAVADLTVEDWCAVFDIDRFKTQGLLLGEVIERVKKGYTADVNGEEREIPGVRNGHFSIGDMRQCIEYDVHINSKGEGYASTTRRSILARLKAAERWGIFSLEGTPITDISVNNNITVIDVSHPDLGEDKRALIAGILARKIFEARMATSRREETEGDGLTYGNNGNIPVTWLLIDEAHLILPHTGRTPGTEALVEYAKLGRKPGCALVLATQRPAATNDEVLSQMDALIGHNLALEDDMVALRRRIPSKLPGMIADSDFIRALPVGVAIMADQRTQKRTLVAQMRPRLSKHSGKSATPRRGGDVTPRSTRPKPEKDSATIKAEVMAPTFSINMEPEAMKKAVKAAEKGKKVPPKPRVTDRIAGANSSLSVDMFPGTSCALIDREGRVFEEFNAILNDQNYVGRPTLIVSHTHPRHFQGLRRVEQVKRIFWLSTKQGGEKDEVEVLDSNLTKIAKTIEDFMPSQPGSIVLLEGLEFLVSRNDFSRVMHFVEDMRSAAVANEGLFVYSYNPGVFSQAEANKLKTEADLVMDIKEMEEKETRVEEGERKGKKEGEKPEETGQKEGAEPSDETAEALEREKIKMEKEKERLIKEINERDKEKRTELIEEVLEVMREERKKIEEELKQLEGRVSKEVEERENRLRDEMKALDAQRETIEEWIPVEEKRKEKRKRRVSKPKAGLRSVVDVVDVDTSAPPAPVEEGELPQPDAEKIGESTGWVAHAYKKKGKTVHAVPLNVSEPEALKTAEKSLDRRFMGLGKKTETIQDIELIAYPLFRIYLKSKGGLIRREKIYTLMFDGVLGELITDGKKGLQRTQGLSHLYGHKEKDVQVLLELSGRKGMDPGSVSSKLDLPLDWTKRALKRMAKKGLITEDIDKDTGSKVYKRKFKLKTPRKWTRDVDDFPMIDECYISRAFIPLDIKPKEVKKLLNALEEEAMFVGMDVIFYPYYLITVKGKTGRRFAYVDGVSGELDEMLGINLLKVELVEKAPKIKGLQ